MATGVAPVRRCTRAGVPARTRLRRDVCVGRQIRRVTTRGSIRTRRSRSTLVWSAAPVAEKNGRHHPIFVTAHDLRAWQGLSVDSSRRGDGRRGEGRRSRYAGHRGGDDAVVQRRRAGGVGVALGLRILGRRGRGVARRGRRLVPGTRPTRGAPTHARGGLRRARETRPRGLRGRGRGRGAVGRRAIASSSFAANAVAVDGTPARRGGLPRLRRRRRRRRSGRTRRTRHPSVPRTRARRRRRRRTASRGERRRSSSPRTRSPKTPTTQKKTTPTTVRGRRLTPSETVSRPRAIVPIVRRSEPRRPRDAPPRLCRGRSSWRRWRRSGTRSARATAGSASRRPTPPPPETPRLRRRRRRPRRRGTRTRTRRR